MDYWACVGHCRLFHFKPWLSSSETCSSPELSNGTFPYLHVSHCFNKFTNFFNCLSIFCRISSYLQPIFTVQGDVHVNYTKSWVWRGGLLLIIVGSLADLGALAFAPQSLVAPLGSLTLVSNIIYAPLILKETIDPLSIGSTLVIVIGSAFAVAYAPHEEVAYTTPDLFGLFFSLGFVLFCLCLLLLLGGLLGLARHCEMVESAHGRGSTAYISLRSLHQFTYPAASGIVGAQSVLFAKCASRLGANSSEGMRVSAFSPNFVCR